MQQRNRAVLWILVAVWFLQLQVSVGLRAQIIISEFVAANATSLTDSNREHSDWLELYNTGKAPVRLGGYFLTDQPDEPEKWPLPDVELAADEFLIIFASGKDRRNPADELHTNFKLARGGEFLALLAPGGQLASHFGAGYPPQVTDAAYGVSQATGGARFVETSTPVRFLNPRTPLGVSGDWLLPEFDDSAWIAGTMPLGFDRNESPIYQDLIQTDVGDLLFEVNSALFVRIVFQLDEPPVGHRLALRLQYDDGFAAFLNGTKLASDNVPSVVRARSSAIRQRTPTVAREFTLFRLSSDALVAGNNVLAIQIANDRRNDPDLLLTAELAAVVIEAVDVTSTGYLAPTTPRWPNGQPLPAFSPTPTISPVEGLYTEPFQVELTSPDPAAEIRYALDGTLATHSSPLYTAPFTLDHNAILNARAFSPGKIPGEAAIARYSVLDPSLLDFSSDLPLVVITAEVPPTPAAWNDMRFDLFTPAAEGRSRLALGSSFRSAGQVKVRGSSSEGRAKRSMNIEIQDENGRDKDVPLLGMPAESDWILYGALDFDLARMRNAYIYRLGREIAADAGRDPGSYGVRTRFCEVFVSIYGQPISDSNYLGLYSLMEKIKRGPERVNVAELDPDATEEPAISGGYIVKIDRADPGDVGFSAGGQGLKYVEPKEEDIRTRPEQVTWIREFFNRMASSIGGAGLEPLEQITENIDVQSWIDHSWLNILPMNVDAYRLSGYMHLDRGGKLVMGPIWDFDRSAGSTDGRDVSPTGWRGGGDATSYFNYPWWNQLHRNQAYVRLWEGRWRELRQNLLSTEHIHAVIDDMATETAEAWVRDDARWATRTTQETAVNHLKNWLQARAEWIDGQTVPRPFPSHLSGVVTPGLEVTLSIEGGDLYYTLNGPDPADEDGGPAAILHSGESIVIDETITLRARGFLEGIWSNLVEEVYTPRSLPLVLTEIMFDPPRAPDNPTLIGSRYEFLEIQNAGTEVIDLTKLRFTQPRFSLPETAENTLAPGAFLLLVNDPPSFTARYGTDGLQVAGEFSGSLSNLRDDIEILNEKDEPVIQFVYVGSWQPLAREGHSLVPRDPTAAVETVGLETSWVPSAEPLGSPGRADGASASTSGRRVVGDVNGDARLNIVDGLAMIEHIFRAPQELPCDTADANRILLDFDGNGSVSIADPIGVLGFLFRAEAPPALGAGCQPLADCSERCSG